MALHAYVTSKQEVFEGSALEIAELMTDLLHLAAQVGDGDNPPEGAIQLARAHFEAEQLNPKNQR